MRILLTNDDGIHAPGIAALHRAIADMGEIMVVAPLTVQSATSHGITFHEPLMTEPVELHDGTEGIAVDGRPADCVKLALEALWPERFGPDTRPDVVISGMNAGANVGINVLYSGTVAAAVEAAFHGVPSIAASLHLGDRTRIRFDRAAEIARETIDRVMEHPLDPHGVVNINVPRTERDDAPMPPIRVVEMNTAAGIAEYERRESPDGRVYYWVRGSGLAFRHTRDNTDVEALLARTVTVTPLNYDMTDHARLGTWRERLES